jgi:UDP-N-acetylmuramoyl-tripeptide--D-alanyl-D-alanine ligase
MSNVEMVIFLLGLSCLVVVRINTLLVYFQQEEYDTARFIKAIFRVWLFDILASLVIVIFIVVYYLVPAFNPPIGAMGGIVSAGLAVRERRYKYKKRVALTDRLRRLRVVAIILMMGTLPLPAVYFPFALITLQLPPVAIMLANWLLARTQRRIDQRYIDEAREKLARYAGTRIAITGSFGKTTVKHVLGDLLSTIASVYYSRGSINTVLGLTRHIRERLQHGNRFLIAEMGAYGEGSIRRLCEFIQPTIGVITAIGDAHTERFGTREAVGRAKGELAQWVVSKGGLVVISEQVAAFEPFASLLTTNRGNFLVCGASQDADLLVRTRLKGMTREVDIRIRSMNNRDLRCEIPSLGEYEAINVSLAVAVITRTVPALLDQLPFLLPNLAQVPHRLEIKDRPGQALVLDDAYNSNETGFRGAVDVMRGLADNRGGRAILITPGIIELGAEHDAVHARLGTYCATRCDVVIAVNPDRIKSFVGALRDSDGTARLIEADTLAGAREALMLLSPTSADVVLYENDLPDVHEASRIL